VRLKTNLEGAFGTPVVLNLGSRNGRDSLVGVLLMVRGRLSSSLRWWRAQARSAGVLGRTLVMVARWSLARERSGEVERVGIDEAEADEVVEEGGEFFAVGADGAFAILDGVGEGEKREQCEEDELHGG
jgi:hypothetical protein